MKSFNIEGLKELSPAESSAVNGGESLWYWAGYFVGDVAKDLVEAYEMAKICPPVAAHILAIKWGQQTSPV